jgi:cytochrome c
MKTVIMSLVFMALPAWADNTLLVKNNCLACHNVNQTVVGPSFKDVANRYRGQADAADRLAKKYVQVVLVFGEPCPCLHIRRYPNQMQKN